MVTHETPLVLTIKKAILRVYPGAWAFKVVGSREQESGVPDLLVVVDGLLIGLEVKFQRPGESRQHALSRATPLQLGQLRKLRAAGAAAEVVTSKEEALAVIAEALLRHRAQVVESLRGDPAALRRLLDGLPLDVEDAEGLPADLGGRSTGGSQPGGAGA